MKQTRRKNMMRRNSVLHYLWNMMIIMALGVVLASCAGQASAPTSQTDAEQIPLETPTAIPSPAPTHTPTSMPEMPEAPFTWTGTGRPLLMAHYMPWYQTPEVSGQWGWHWTMNHFTPTQAEDGQWMNFASHYTPQVGLYDSSDEAVLEYQVQLMKLSGIDGVIVDWYGIENFWDYGAIHASTQKLFEVIKRADLKFVVCYEDQTIKHMVENDHIKGEDAIGHAQEVMRYLHDTWFSDEAYLQLDNQPLLFTFGPQYFKSGEDWNRIFSVIDPRPLFITLDNPTPGAAGAAFPWPPMWASKSGVLSHDILLSYLTDFYDKSQNWQYFVGGAFPGFHDIYQEANVGASYGYLDALDGKTLRFTLQEALDQNPDMIQLITWNDYGEGTIIEPTLEFGNQYLEMVQEARKTTSGGDFSFNTEDLRLPLELYQLRVKYASDADVTAELNLVSDELLTGNTQTVIKVIETYR